MKYEKIGAVCFALWGLYHVLGGAVGLLSLEEGVANGYAVFLNSEGDYPQLAGKILGFHMFNIVWIGVLVTVIAVKLNWKNKKIGALLNLTLAGFSDLGVAFFLLIPGFVSLPEASVGFILLALGAMFCFWSLIKANNS